MGQISGTINLAVNVSDLVPAGAHFLAPYNVGIAPAIAAGTGAWAYGTGPNQAQKSFMQAGTFTASTVVPIDLTACICSDGTTGFNHVRYIVVYNDATASGVVLTLGEGANAFAPYLAGTSPTLTVAAGMFVALGCPLNATGWPVTTGAKIFELDPGANAFAYRVIFLGD